MQFRRDAVLVAGAVALLGASFVIPWRLHALVVGLAAMIAITRITWANNEFDLLKQRLGGAITYGVMGFGAAFFVVVQLGAVAFVLCSATLLLCAATLERTRLRGTTVPAEGEPSGRVAFEGTVHALGEPPRIPGTDREVPVWVAMQGDKRWASTSRFEIRGADRRVLVEPGRTRLRGKEWVMALSTGREAARVLGGDLTQPRRLEDPVRVWSFQDGDTVHVVGRVTLEDDAGAATLRDPSRVSVFRDGALVGPGQLAVVRRSAALRVWMWSAVAIAAGGLLATGFDGLG